MSDTMKYRSGVVTNTGSRWKWCYHCPSFHGCEHIHTEAAARFSILGVRIRSEDEALRLLLERADEWLDARDRREQLAKERQQELAEREAILREMP